jgi:hypothetical protein
VSSPRSQGGLDGKGDGDGDPALEPDPTSDVDLEQATSNDGQPVQPASPGAVVSKLALAIMARHAIELVETQGFPALVAYHEKKVATPLLQGSPSWSSNLLS